MSAPIARASVLLALVAAVLLPVAVQATPADPVAAKVAPDVLSATSGGGRTSFIVVLSAKPDLSAAATMSTKLAKGTFVYDALRDTALRSQAPVRALLDRSGVRYHTHIIVNAITVESAGRSVVDALAARPDVSQIVGNPWIRSIVLPNDPAKPAPDAGTHAAPGRTVEWNIQRIRAPQVWATGDTGQGIVLGNIDTGQQWDHPALKPHYRGWNGTTADHNYNWYDATDPSNRAPLDPYGHGTHTAGIMVGDDGNGNQIGVAPGAKWMSCRSMDSAGFGSPDTYITCMEFMLAPWDLDGQNPDPSMAPVAVSDSWYCSISQEGCSQGVLLQAVTNLRDAGIVPVFAAGNSGPACRTIGDDGPPAQYDQSFTVGATTSANTLASFSSRGPVRFMGQMLTKPDISAPGEGVRSSYPPNTYAVLSGTSMATPHIAGTIALIYEAKPSLIGNVDATEQLIENTAVHKNASSCSSSGTYPNNLYGWGIVNAQAAVLSH
jgi:subtilisin family serine protease